MTLRSMPWVTRLALGIYALALLAQLVTNWLVGLLLGLLALPMIIFQAFLLAGVWRRRLWARYALAALLAFALWREWVPIGNALAALKILHVTAWAAALTAAPRLLDLIAVGLLFTPASSRWFKEESPEAPDAHSQGAEHASSQRRSFTNDWPVAAGILIAGLPIAGVHWLTHSLTQPPPPPSGRDIGELKPGAEGYPVANPNPTHIVRLTVIGADAKDMEFSTGWSTDVTRCGHQLGLGGYFPVSLAFPVATTRTTEGTRGSIEIDHFAPGDCGWQFGGISYGMVGGVHNALATLEGPGTRKTSVTPTVEFWCYRVVNDGRPVHNCESLAMLKWSDGVRAVSRQFLAHFASAQLFESRVPAITADTQEIRVVLYDLNDTPGALVPVGDREMQAARAEEDRAANQATPEYQAYECIQRENFAYAQSHHPLPDAAAQNAALETIKKKCRANVGLAPEEQ